MRSMGETRLDTGVGLLRELVALEGTCAGRLGTARMGRHRGRHRGGQGRSCAHSWYRNDGSGWCARPSPTPRPHAAARPGRCGCARWSSGRPTTSTGYGRKGPYSTSGCRSRTIGRAPSRLTRHGSTRLAPSLPRETPLKWSNWMAISPRGAPGPWDPGLSPRRVSACL